MAECTATTDECTKCRDKVAEVNVWKQLYIQAIEQTRATEQLCETERTRHQDELTTIVATVTSMQIYIDELELVKNESDNLREKVSKLEHLVADERLLHAARDADQCQQILESGKVLVRERNQHEDAMLANAAKEAELRDCLDKCVVEKLQAHHCWQEQNVTMMEQLAEESSLNKSREVARQQEMWDRDRAAAMLREEHGIEVVAMSARIAEVEKRMHDASNQAREERLDARKCLATVAERAEEETLLRISRELAHREQMANNTRYRMLEMRHHMDVGAGTAKTLAAIHGHAHKLMERSLQSDELRGEVLKILGLLAEEISQRASRQAAHRRDMQEETACEIELSCTISLASRDKTFADAYSQTDDEGLSAFALPASSSTALLDDTTISTLAEPAGAGINQALLMAAS